MKVAIIGYGAMGHEIEQVLREKGHEITLTVDAGEEWKMSPDVLRDADVAIEFSTPSSAFDNVTACLRAGIPVVCGTTGWNDRRPEAENLCKQLNGTMFWSSNFSIGVNVLFRVNRYLANIMSHLSSYDVSIRELHHTRKKDAPSGTAITLAEDIIACNGNKKSWVNYATDNISELGIVSVREGDVSGIHEITYISDCDTIELSHSAKSRHGFAVGAVMAAEYAARHKGVLSMDDMLDELL